MAGLNSLTELKNKYEVTRAKTSDGGVGVTLAGLSSLARLKKDYAERQATAKAQQSEYNRLLNLDLDEASRQSDSAKANTEMLENARAKLKSERHQQTVGVKYSGRNKEKIAALDKKIAALDEQIETAKNNYTAKKSEYQYANLYQQQAKQQEQIKQHGNYSADVNENEDDAYYRAVNGLVAAGTKLDIARNRATGNTVSSNSKLIYNQMTDEERNTYNYIFDTEGSEAAKKYLEILEYDLAADYKQQRTKDAQEWVNNGHAVSGTAMSIAEGAVSDTGGALSFYGEKALRDLGIIDSDLPINYQKTFASSTWSNATQEQVLENIDSPVGQFLYSTGVSIADNVARNLLFGSFGKIGTLGVMAARVAGQSVNEGLERGMSEDQAASYGVSTAIGEVIGEIMPLDHLLKIKSPKTLKEALLSLGGQALVEGAGEGITTLWNYAVSGNIAGELSDYNMAKAEYIKAGYSEEEAEKQATKDMLKQLGLDMAGGFVSGAAMGGGAMALDSMLNRASGSKAESKMASSLTSDIDKSEIEKRANKYQRQGMSATEAAQKAQEDIQNEKIKSYTGKGMSAEEATAAVQADDIAAEERNKKARGKILSRGLNATDGSEANKAATAIKAKLDNGEAVTAKEWQSLIKETGKSISLEETKTAIKTAAQKSGESIADTDVDVMAAAMEKNFRGKNMTDAENKLIKNSSAAKAAYSELTGLDYDTGEVVPGILEKEQQAQYQSVKAKIDNAKSRMVTEYAGEGKSEDYKNTLSNTYKAYLSIAEHASETDKTLVYSKISAEDFADTFDAFYNAGKSGEDSLAALKNELKNRNAGKAAIDAFSTAYELGRDEKKRGGIKNAKAKQAELNAQLKSGNEGKARAPRGVARSITAAELDTDAAKEAGAKAIDMKRHFSQKQRTAIAFARELAKVSDINIVFYQTEGSKGANGWYDRESDTIYIDLFSGFKNEQAMLRTLSHELTHFIEKYSPEHYEGFKNFLLDYYYGKDEGATLERLIENERKLAPNQSHEYWENEVVANASEMFVKDEGAMRALIGEHADIAKSVDQWFSKMNYALRRAYKGVSASGEAAAELAANVEVFSEAQQRWNALLKESVEAKKAASGVEQSSKNDVSFSLRNEFAKEIDRWNRNGRADDESFILGSTGDILQGLGAIESDIYLNGDKIKTILETHPEMTINEIKMIGQIVENPAIVLKSKNVKRKGNSNTRLVMFGNIKAQNGKPILAVLDLRPVEKNLVINDMQKISSAYTKTSEPANFIKQSSVVYLDKKRAPKVLRAIGFQMPIALAHSGFIGSITYSRDNVNISGKDFRSVVDTSIQFSKRAEKFSQLDSEYAKAVESNDTETAEKLVEEAARAAGYNSPLLYHGTQSFGFTKIDVSKSDDGISFFSTTNPDMAQTYSGEYGKRAIGRNYNDIPLEDVVSMLNDALREKGSQSTYRIMSRDDVGKLESNISTEAKAVTPEIVKVLNEAKAGSSTYASERKINKISSFLDALRNKDAESMYQMLYDPYQSPFGDRVSLALRLKDLVADMRLKNRIDALGNVDEILVAEMNGRRGIGVSEGESARRILKNYDNSGNYALYGKTDDFFEVDGGGTWWSNIFATLEPKGGNTFRAEYDSASSTLKLSDKNGQFAEIPASTLSEMEPAMARAITKRYGKYFAAKVLAQARDQLRNSASAEVDVKTIGTVSTREIAQFAKEQGYRGAKITDIFDNGGRGNGADTGDVYIFFNPETDVKSADAVTYDDKGNVIPLSERFNEKNDDIRFSKRTDSAASGEVTLEVQDSKDEDKYTYETIGIMLDGKEVGSIGLMVDDIEPYLERIDVWEKYRNKGIGTDALRLIAEKYGDFWIAPDNEDARRLYERYGDEITNYDALDFDQGYGVYEISSVPEDKGYTARQRAQQNAVSDLGKVQYQLRTEDKNRLDILDKQEERLANDLKTLEKAYGKAIREEYERNIKPNEEMSKKAAEINRKAAQRFMNEVGAMSHMAKAGREKYLLPIINEIIDKGPTISESEGLIDELYRTAYRNSSAYAAEDNERDKELKDYIRKTAIYVDAGTRSDMGDYNSFRKNNMGKLRLTSDTHVLSLDVLYDEIRNIAPDSFSDTTDGAEKLYELAAFMEQRYESISDYMSEDEFVDWAMNGGSNLNAELENLFDRTIGSFYDEASRKENERTKAAKVNRAMENVRSAAENYNAAREYARAESEKAQEYARAEGFLAGQIAQGAYDAKTIGRRLERYQQKLKDVRTRRDEILKEQRDAYAKYREKRTDTVKRSTLRRKIARNVKRLSSMLVNPTDNRHIPQGLRGAVAGFLDNFANDTSVFAKSKLDALKAAYSDIAKEDNSLYELYDPDMAEYIDTLQETINGKRLSELSADELNLIDRVTGYFTHIVRDGNKLFIDGKRQSVNELVQETISAADTNGNKVYRGGAAGKALRGADRFFNYQSVTPVYFFKRMGGGMEKLYNDVLYNGQLTYSKDVNADQEFMAAIFERYHVWDWTSANKKNKKDILKLQTARGATLEMTRNEVLSTYATYKRGMANGDGAAHIRQGGIVVKSKTPDSVFKEYIESSRGIQLEIADVQKMFSFLTDEQKACADAVVKYLTVTEGEKRNETSMQLYGYKKFNESYYFPYRVASDYVKSHAGDTIEADGKATGSKSKMIKSMGSSKALTPNANAAIVIDDFFKVAAESMSDTARYHAFAVQQDNFMRVLNYKDAVDTEHGGSTSVKQAIRDSYGTEGLNYITGFLGDISGGAVQIDNGGFINELFGKFKKTAVAANLSVAIQQPSAIMRATAFIDAKYLAKTVGQKNHLQEMFDYSSTAFLKNMGRFDIGTGRSTEQYILKPELKGKEFAKQLLATGEYSTGALDDVTGYLSEKADWITWGHLMNAVMAEIEDTTDLKRGTEEFKQAVGRRFDEIVNQSQVYDSVLTKSPIMRSKNSWNQLMSAFMTEPTLSYNMVLDGLKNWKTNPGYLGKTLVAYALSVIANALLKSVIGAMRDKDEDKTYLEKYAEKFAGNVVGDLNPVLNLPYVSQTRDVLQGGTVENQAYGMMSDAVSAIENSYKKVQDEDYIGALGELTVVLNLTGLPVRNIYRDASAIFNTVFNTKPLKDTTLEGMFEAATDGVMDSSFIGGITGNFIDTSKTAGIKSAMRGGNTAKIQNETNEVIKKYVSDGKSESAAKGYIKTALTNYWKPRYLKADAKKKGEIRKALYATGLYKNSDAVVEMCRKWEQSGK